jgi:hypothetical protein
MGFSAELVIADRDEAQAVVDSDQPSRDWDGFLCNGFDSVKLCTLLSILKTGSPHQAFGEFQNDVRDVTWVGGEGRWIEAVSSDAVALLATVAQCDDDQFEILVAQWAQTEEFDGWKREDVKSLLRNVGDLAETALLQDKGLLLSMRS